MTRKLVIFKCMTDLVSIPDYIMKYSEIPAMQRLKNIDMNTVYEAYTSALKWYRTVR